MPVMPAASVPNSTITVARCYVAAAAIGYFFDLLHQAQNQLVNARGRPFGDDFLNYWSGAFLALHGRGTEVYDFAVFHAFGQSVVGSPLDYYQYNYPPVMLLLSAPIALIPYVPALFVWLSASWYAFYRALRLAMPGRGALLVALATPAVLVNAAGGQNGCWTAALLGGGLSLLERKPYLAGAMFGTMIYKPHLGLLLPVALIAGRQWRVIAAAAVTAGLLLGLSTLVLGLDLWSLYLRNITALGHVSLEIDLSPRMVAVFIAARSLGASVEAAYLVQAAVGALACLAVAMVWFKDSPAALKNAVLVLSTCLAVPYLQDYDLVFCAFVVVWLWQQPVEAYHSERALQIACALLLLLPLAAAALARFTGITFGPLFFLPAFIMAVQAAFVGRAAAPAPLTASRGA